MADISSALRSTIPISLFNRGMAGKVFEDVRRQGAKVVICLLYTSPSPRD